MTFHDISWRTKEEELAVKLIQGLRRRPSTVCISLTVSNSTCFANIWNNLNQQFTSNRGCNNFGYSAEQMIAILVLIDSEALFDYGHISRM